MVATFLVCLGAVFLRHIGPSPASPYLETEKVKRSPAPTQPLTFPEYSPPPSHYQNPSRNLQLRPKTSLCITACCDNRIETCLPALPNRTTIRSQKRAATRPATLAAIGLPTRAATPLKIRTATRLPTKVATPRNSKSTSPRKSMENSKSWILSEKGTIAKSML